MTWQYSSDLLLNFNFVNDFVAGTMSEKFRNEYKGVFERNKDKHHHKKEETVVEEVVKIQIEKHSNNEDIIITEEIIIEKKTLENDFVTNSL